MGFEVVDALARAQGVNLNKLQEGAAVARCSVAGHRVVLAKPMTFMNNSGGPVRKLVNFYKVRAGTNSGHAHCFEVTSSATRKDAVMLGDVGRRSEGLWTPANGRSMLHREQGNMFMGHAVVISM